LRQTGLINDNNVVPVWTDCIIQHLAKACRAMADETSDLVKLNKYIKVVVQT